MDNSNRADIFRKSTRHWGPLCSAVILGNIYMRRLKWSYYVISFIRENTFDFVAGSVLLKVSSK